MLSSVMSIEPALVGSLPILANLVNTALTICVFRTKWRVMTASDLDTHQIQRKAGIQAPGNEKVNETGCGSGREADLRLVSTWINQGLNGNIGANPHV